LYFKQYFGKVTEQSTTDLILKAYARMEPRMLPTVTDLSATTEAPIAIQLLDNNLVDARDLHMTLLVGRDFSNWIKDKLSDFEKDNDYRVAKTGEHGKIDYHLTLDVAKQICMLERNARGKAVRRYFVECEKNFHTIHNQLEMMLSNPENAIKVFQKLADSKKEIEKQTRIANYALTTLTSSQANTAKQTRKVHELQAELKQLNRMVSMLQWCQLRKPEIFGVEPKLLTKPVREMLQAQGHECIQQTLPNDKFVSWTFKKSALDDNADRIVAIAKSIALKASVKHSPNVRELKTPTKAH
jgi:phage anti-repressor protein